MQFVVERIVFVKGKSIDSRVVAKPFPAISDAVSEAGRLASEEGAALFDGQNRCFTVVDIDTEVRYAIRQA